MKLDPDQTKQAKEVIFSQNPQNTNHSCLIFTHNVVELRESQKHVGKSLDFGLDFKEHLEIIIKKDSKTIGVLCKFQSILPRKSLITVYKSF